MVGTHQMAKLHESRQRKRLPSFEGFRLKKENNRRKNQTNENTGQDYLGGRDPKTLADCVTVRLWS